MLQYSLDIRLLAVRLSFYSRDSDRNMDCLNQVIPKILYLFYVFYTLTNSEQGSRMLSIEFEYILQN